MSNWGVGGGSGARGVVGTEGALSPALATAHTKGAWTQIVASTPFEACGIDLMIGLGSTSGDSRFLVDLSIGPAGSESSHIIAANLFVGGMGYRSGAHYIALPLAIPAGARLSVRHSCNAGPTDWYVIVHAGLRPAHPLLPRGFSACTTVGVNEANTHLTPVTQKYVTPTWYELTAATPQQTRAMMVVSGGLTTGTAGASGTLMIAVGPAGGEREVVGGQLVHTFSGIPFGTIHRGPTPVSIPAGSRLSAAVLSSSAANLHAVGLLLFH